MARLSGLQKEVLVLYRSCLREARKKPEVSSPLTLLLELAWVNTDTNNYRQVGNTLKYLRGWPPVSLISCQVKRTNPTVRTEFEKNLGVEKRDFAAIEFLLRKGRRQLDSYSAPGIKDIK